MNQGMSVRNCWSPQLHLDRSRSCTTRRRGCRLDAQGTMPCRGRAPSAKRLRLLRRRLGRWLRTNSRRRHRWVLPACTASTTSVDHVRRSGRCAFSRFSADTSRPRSRGAITCPLHRRDLYREPITATATRLTAAGGSRHPARWSHRGSRRNVQRLSSLIFTSAFLPRIFREQPSDAKGDTDCTFAVTHAGFRGPDLLRSPEGYDH